MTNTMTKTKTLSKTAQKKLTKGCKITKKTIMMFTTMAIMSCLFSINAFAATGVVDTSSFITTACTVLKSVICLIGAGVGVWGVVNLLEGYGNDNPGAKSQGIKQLMSGGGIIIVAQTVIPQLSTLFS